MVRHHLVSSTIAAAMPGDATPGYSRTLFQSFGARCKKATRIVGMAGGYKVRPYKKRLE
jgi:hypothetical protein